MKAGYKRTEVGLIPEDWNVTTIGDIADVKTGPFGSSLHQSDYVEQGTPIITVEHLGERGVKHFNLPLVSDDDLDRLRAYSLEEGDIVFSRVGSIDRNALVSKKEADWLFSGRLLRVRLKNDKNYSPYLSYYFHSEAFKQRVRSVAVGQTMPSLNTEILKGILVVLPTGKEQRAIARMLGDVDRLIAELDKLIAKKRAVKTAVMQELLTGKTRLPGFGTDNSYKHTEVGFIPEDWECLRIPDVTQGNANSIKIGPFGSQLKKELLTRTGYKVYGQENVFEKDMQIGERFINEEHFRRLKSCEILPGDFLISMMGTVGKCMIVPSGIQRGIMDSHLLRLRLDNSKFLSRLLLQLFESKIIFDQVKELSVGGIMAGLSSKIVKNIYLPVPPIREQGAMVEALDDIDAEIAAIEARRDKTKAIKQGMMQELLTGRTRLVNGA